MGPAHAHVLAPCSGWLAAIGFFQTSVGAAVVMLLPAIMFSMSAAMMAIMIMKVSPPAPGMVHFLPHILFSDLPALALVLACFRSKRPSTGE